MAIYYFDMQNLKIGYGKQHSDYINGVGKYEYKAKEVVYKKENLPKFADDSSDFWHTADCMERCNARLGKTIKLSLPKELTLQENIDLLNNYLEKELGDKYYYSAVIHDKESSAKGIQNIHAHIIVCPRLRDGIERDRDVFFKTHNSKNLEKSGGKKDEYWNKKSTLLHLRKSWEVTLNEVLVKKNIKTVSCESLKKQKQMALEKGDKNLAALYDREPISIKGYILKKDEDDLTPEEKTQLDIFKMAKKLKDYSQLMYDLNQSLEELKERETKINHSFDFVEKTVEEFSFADKSYKNLYDIEENILMLEIEEKNILDSMSEDDDSSDLLASIRIRKEGFINLLNQELEKLSDEQEFTKVYDEFNAMYFSTEFKRYWHNLRKIEFNIKKIEEFQDKLKNIDDVVFSIMTKGKYGKELAKYKGSLNRLNKWNESLQEMQTKYKGNKNSISKEDEEKLKLINDKIAYFSDKVEKQDLVLDEIKMKCLNNKKYDETYHKTIRKYSFLIEKISKENDTRRIQNEVLKDKCDFTGKGDVLFDTLSIFRKQINSLDAKIDYNELKIKALKRKLDYNLKFGIYDSLTDNRYSNLLKLSNDLEQRISEKKTELNNTFAANIFKQMQLKNEISNLDIEKKSIENQFEKLVNSIPKQTIKAATNKLMNEYNAEVKVLKNENYDYNTEKYAMAFASKSIREEIYPLTKGGSPKNVQDFVSKYHANLGKIDTLGINLDRINKDDKLAIQMKKELDFF